MPSKCFLTKLHESIEDVKIISEYYKDEDDFFEGIEEMIPTVKYLLASISDVLNEGLGRNSNFYAHYQQFSCLIGPIDPHWDDFDKGLNWIIQKLNTVSLSSTLRDNYDKLCFVYKKNSLMIERKESLFDCLEYLERNVKFKLHCEDLYETRIRRRKRIVNDQIETIDTSSEMASSFISMEAVDANLLQEREMRNDFGFINKLKYNSIRFINNFRVSRLKPLRSDFRIENGNGNGNAEDEFESINIFSCSSSSDKSDRAKETAKFDIENMEICPERGMTSQNYCCAQCKNGISSKDSIKCDFSGNYLCPKCHGGRECINPVRILRNWDFKRYPIGTESRRLIAKISYNNLINFPKMNPKEFKTNEKFKQIQSLREKIYKSAERRLREAGKVDGAKQLLILEKLAWPKTHLLTSINLYTIEDLIEIERGTFQSSVLQPLYNLLKL